MQIGASLLVVDTHAKKVFTNSSFCDIIKLVRYLIDKLEFNEGGIFMKKRIVILLLIVGIICILSACSNEEPPDLNDTGAPESYFVYGFNEECSDGTKHIKVESFEISTSYNANEITTNGSGYYVVLEVTTNLTENDFSNQDNVLELWLSPSQMTNLSFVSWDIENGKLVYEIPQNSSFDYSQLSSLKISDSGEQFSSLNLIFDVFDKYCTIDDIQYCGRIIELNLE